MISGIFTSQITGQNEDGTPIYDRAVDEEFLSRYLGVFTSNGVFNEKSTSLKVYPNMDFSVDVQPGACFINGHFGYIKQAQQIDLIPSGATSRTDSIVARLSVVERSIDLVVKTGSTELRRDSDVWELALAWVIIPARSTKLSFTNIVDTRGDSERCGYVYNHLQQIDTTELFSQYDAAFKQWFQEIKGILNEDAAGNLYNMITPLLDGNAILNMEALPVGTTWTWWNDNLPSDKWAFGNTDIPEDCTKARAIWGTKTPDTAGRVLVDKSSTVPEFNAVNKAYGETAHTLIVLETPPHKHKAYFHHNAASPGSITGGFPIGEQSNQNWDVPTETVGGGAPHNNIQPSIVCRFIYKIR